MPALSASKILLKGTDVPSKVPALASLELRELAVNTADGKLFLKTTDDVIVSFLNSSELPYAYDRQENSIVFATQTFEVGQNSDPSTLYVEEGKMGINTQAPNKSLTVVGDISATGSIEPDHIVLKSPNGTRWKITVSNQGHLSTEEL